MAKSKMKVLNVKNVAVAVLLVVFIVGVGMFFIKYTPSLTQSQAAGGGRAGGGHSSRCVSDSALRCNVARQDYAREAQGCARGDRAACLRSDTYFDRMDANCNCQ